MLWRIKKQVMEEDTGVLWTVARLSREVNAGLTEKEIVYEKLEGVEGVSTAALWGKGIPGRGNRENRSPVV